jgi:ComF family protein
MIGDFKFRSRRDYFHFFADELEICYKHFYPGCQIKALVPVPIHPSRKRFRGYNQSELLCRELSKRLDLPVYDCLKRQRKTAPQKTLSPEERRKNLFDAMSFEEPKEFVNADYKPECVLIVDDIFTTGATSEACADILKMNGIERVYVLNIATGNKIN